MKKTAIRAVCLAVLTALILCLVSCGGNQKKQEAIDAFNKVSTVMDDFAADMNENADLIETDMFDTYNQMVALMKQYKAILEGDDEISDEQFDTMIEWFGTVEEWATEGKAELDRQLSEISG